MVRWALLGALLAACGTPAGDAPDAGALDAGAPDALVYAYPFPLPAGFPPPRLPGPLTAELAELGRHLFYDVRLSGNQTQSCASCHEQARAFSDGRVGAIGSTGEVNRRNAPSLTNVAYNPTQTWATPILVTLEQQALVPLFGLHPVELAADGDEVLARLRGEARYAPLFAAAFPGIADPFTIGNVANALAAFERRLISGNSLADRAGRGEVVLPDDVARGKTLFFGERLECHHCHGGFNSTHAVDHANLAGRDPVFFNTGLYNVGGAGDYPAADQGLFEITGLAADRGRFKPPTLRNIAVTAPYMHDGSVATLEEVIEIYERGGQLIATGPDAGDGKLNPNKNAFVGGFQLTPQERADLLAYLEALTDETFLTDPTLADPWAP